MARSYLGIVTRRGLESLVPETEHAVPFLLRRAGRWRPTPAFCCWAVLPEIAFFKTQYQLDCGHFRDALLTLNAEALHLGTLLPSTPVGADTGAL